jgi:Ca2+:H+ antiporter
MLAVSVTVIEVSLIVSIMLTMADAATDVARDTVFATVMIVLNGVVGLCLLIGGIHHREQGFQSQGAAGALGVIGTLATLALILPTFTLAAQGPVYSPPQLIFVGVVSLLLYGLFLFVQTVRHRSDFIDAATALETTGVAVDGHPVPSTRAAALSGVFLLLSLVAVSLLVIFGAFLTIAAVP